MEWSVAEIGAGSLEGVDASGVLIQVGMHGRYPARLTEAGATRLDALPPRDEPSLAPFVRTELGKKVRLAWPRGATSLGRWSRMAVWDERFAVAFDDRGFTVIDAEADRLVRLMLDPDDVLRWYGTPVVHGGRLWVWSDLGIISIALADLENLDAGPIAIKLVPCYPLRRSEARLAVVYLWKLQSGLSMVEIGSGNGGAHEPKLEIQLPDLGLAKYSPMTLCDELSPNRYAIAEIPGHPRQAIATLGSEVRKGKVTNTRAKDPVAVAHVADVALPPPERTAEVDRLVQSIANNPDDDGDRAVLVDLLQELGDPTGALIAQVRSGKASVARKKEALGALAPYLDEVELVGGFPVAARLARDAPDADDHPELLAAAAADFRLGLLRALHSRRGAPAIYARLAGSPRATALRCADAADPLVIDALIAAKRDRLTHLEHVAFANAKVMAGLAHPTFDTALTLHTVVGLAHLRPLMNRVIADKAGVFKRARRRLVLEETRNRLGELLQMIHGWWPKLPLAAITIGGLTIERDGKATIARAAGELEADLAAAARRLFGDAATRPM